MKLKGYLSAERLVEFNKGGWVFLNGFESNSTQYKITLNTEEIDVTEEKDCLKIRKKEKQGNLT